MSGWVTRVLLALAIVAAGLPIAGSAEAAAVRLNFGFNAQANVGGTYYGTQVFGQGDVDVTEGPRESSWNATSQGVSFTATLVFSVDSVSPVTVRLIEFRWRAQDGSASGAVPIDGTIRGDASANHTDYSFHRSAEGIDFLFSGSMSVVGPAATPSAGNMQFGTAGTDAGNVINPGTAFPQGTQRLTVRFDAYNLVAGSTVVTWQWFLNGNPLEPRVRTVDFSGNTWFMDSLCAASEFRCDLNVMGSLPTGAYEVRVSIDGTEVLRDFALVFQILG